MYKVFQVRISDKVIDYVNSNERGHTGAADKYPEYNTKMEIGRGVKGFEGEMFNHYTQVCEVADFQTEGNKLEEVFKILNGYYYDEDIDQDETFDTFVSGFTMRSGVRKDGTSYSLRNMHSLSVGDIVFDSINDTYNFVDSYGFKDITSDVLQGVQQPA